MTISWYYDGEWRDMMAVSIEYMAVVVLLLAVAISIRRPQPLTLRCFQKELSASIAACPDGPVEMEGVQLATRNGYLHAFLLS